MIYRVSEKPGSGKYVCINCDEDIYLKNYDEPLPPCAYCEENEFKKE